mmetsp:Transcript_2172/g.3053  ORF Transcript_2172/g.3053 Transcript_2172/m.3053 type:complete len:89 (+) Transcript_2172:1-267(+)
MSTEDEKKRLQASGEYYEPGQGPALEKLGASWVCQEVWAMSEGGNVTRAGYIDGDAYFATARCERSIKIRYFPHTNLSIFRYLAECRV